MCRYPQNNYASALVEAFLSGNMLILMSQTEFSSTEKLLKIVFECEI